jgi:hypothetical protein
MPHEGHFHSSSLHPSITKGSQQSGKQQSSKTAKKIHPPVDSLFLTIKGIPSRPQNGHCDVIGISFQMHVLYENKIERTLSEQDGSSQPERA